MIEDVSGAVVGVCVSGAVVVWCCGVLLSFLSLICNNVLFVIFECEMMMMMMMIVVIFF